MIVNMMKRRVEKILDMGTAAHVTVKTSGAEGLPPYLTLNIGNMLLPNMDLVLDDEAFEADLSLFKAPVRRVRVRWESVIKAEPLPRPDPGGGTGTVLKLAA